MTEELLVTTSIKLRPDQIGKIKESGINFSEWARDCFDKYFMNSNEIDDKIEDYNKEIEKLKERKIILAKDEENDKIIFNEELEFLCETKELLGRRPDCIDGRIISYYNKFGKSRKLSREEFRKLLDRAWEMNLERLHEEKVTWEQLKKNKSNEVIGGGG